MLLNMEAWNSGEAGVAPEMSDMRDGAGLPFKMGEARWSVRLKKCYLNTEMQSCMRESTLLNNKMKISPFTDPLTTTHCKPILELSPRAHKHEKLLCQLKMEMN
jgi:hypothetical protein